MYGLTVQHRPMSPGCSKEPIRSGIVDDPHHRLPLHDQPDGDSELLYTINKFFRPIDRINDPYPRSAQSIQIVRILLGKPSIPWIATPHDLSNCPIGLEIRSGHGIIL